MRRGEMLYILIRQSQPSFRYELVFFSQLNNLELAKAWLLGVISGSTHISKNSFQRMENSRPWRPLLKMRVGSPRPSSPEIPSSLITSCTASAINVLDCEFPRISRRKFEAAYCMRLWCR